MKGFDQFKEDSSTQDILVSFDLVKDGPSLLSNEALFYIPLLAAIVLTLSRLSRKPRTSEIGQMVGDCIERTFTSFKGSSQRLGWSANLRIRTTEALTFLETSGLVEVDDKGVISATKIGRDVILSAHRVDDDLSYTLGLIERSYRDICGERRSRLELI